jgi:hypothetical protein
MGGVCGAGCGYCEAGCDGRSVTRGAMCTHPPCCPRCFPLLLVCSLSACLEWRLLAAVPDINELVAATEASRRRWSSNDGGVRENEIHPAQR